MGVLEHRAGAVSPSGVRVAIISVSDTRSRDTDEGGALVEAMTREAGFVVLGRQVIPDEPEMVRHQLRLLLNTGATEESSGHPGAVPPAPTKPDVVLLTGGTGFAPRDGTVDAVAPLFERRLDGFGELFRMLSFAEIGAAAMLSRACAGIAAGGVAVFLMPGSPAAVRLALSRLILPELAHLIAELRRIPGAGAGRHPPTGIDHQHHGHDDDHRH